MDEQGDQSSGLTRTLRHRKTSETGDSLLTAISEIFTSNIVLSFRSPFVYSDEGKNRRLICIAKVQEVFSGVSHRSEDHYLHQAYRSSRFHVLK